MCRNNVISVTIKEDVLRKRAEQLFHFISGFSKENPPTQYQREDIESVWEIVAPKIQIDAYVKSVLEYSFFENYMMLESKQVYYNLPLSEYREQITGVYVFLISQPSIVEDGQNALEQLYTHIWQNAYLDAAREWLKEWIGKKYASFVSQSIAPGFYGIALDEMKLFYNVVDWQNTFVKLRQDGMLEPEKSVLGMYLTLTEDINILGRQCVDCLARGKNCEFCMEKL